MQTVFLFMPLVAGATFILPVALLFKLVVHHEHSPFPTLELACIVAASLDLITFDWRASLGPRYHLFPAASRNQHPPGSGAFTSWH